MLGVNIVFFVFLSSLQIIRNEETNNKTGESTKLLLYYYALVKYMCLFFDQLTSYLSNQVSSGAFPLHGTTRSGTACYGTARFAFPLQFSTALEWAGLFTCRYSCAASTAVTSS